MDAGRSLPRKPMVLVAGQHAWLLRSIESILGSSGFAVAVRELGEALPGDMAPDLIIVEADDPETSWAELLSRVRPRGVGATPVIATTAEPLTRQRRLEALRAGAWDVMGHPLDAEMMVLKATAFARSKFEADEARERGLIDPETELYNLRGVMRRIYEEASEAERHSRPLACLVAALGQPNGEGNGELAAARTRTAAQALRNTGRASDVLGRLGPNEFVVIAPATDAQGAFRLAQRLTTESVERLPGLQAGYAAVRDVRQAKLEPVDLFVRAVVALRAAQAVGPDERIRSFD